MALTILGPLPRAREPYATVAFARWSAVQRDLILMEWLELLKELLDGKREVCVRIWCEPEGLRIGIDLSRNGEGVGARDSQGDLPPQRGELNHGKVELAALKQENGLMEDSVIFTGKKGSVDSPSVEGGFPASLEQVPISSAEGSEPIQGGVNPPGPKGGLWKLEKLGVVASTKKKLVQWAERIIWPKRLLSNCGGKDPAERKKSERPWQSSGRAWSRSVLV